MRLLSLDQHGRLTLKEFKKNIPSYAILSHTWGQNEYTYADLNNGRITKTAGYRKIKLCGKQATLDKLQYFWVDTCCINKADSNELSEAINSMYKWYSEAEVCYAFLEDLETDRQSDSFDADFKKCRWFTRGWTLQELIAPKEVKFWNRKWVKVGDKDSLASKLIEITGVDHLTLNGPLSVLQLSVANRLSWASRRETTRPEDEAYCLLGIFGISMPLFYGEGGERAFLRLQQEIIRVTEDQSIFAWSPYKACGMNTSTKHWGLLAPSSRFYTDSSQYVPIRRYERSTNISVSPRYVTLQVAMNSEESIVAFECREKGLLGFCGVRISQLRTGQNHYARKDDLRLTTVSEDAWKTFKHVEVKVPVHVHDFDFLMGNLVNYITFLELPSKFQIVDHYPMWGYDFEDETIRIEPYTEEWKGGGSILLFERSHEESSGFVLCLFVKDEIGRPEDLTHFVGVFDNPARKSAREFYYRNFSPWFHDGKDTVLAKAATPVQRNGISAWRLRDGSLVRVILSKDYDHPSLDSLALAKIVAGKSFREISD